MRKPIAALVYLPLSIEYFNTKIVKDVAIIIDKTRHVQRACSKIEDIGGGFNVTFSDNSSIEFRGVAYSITY